MKKNVFDSFTPADVDAVTGGRVKTERLSSTQQARITDTVLNKTGIGHKKPRSRIYTRLRPLAYAACAVLVLSLGIGTFAYAAERREYKTAVYFFEENGLPTDGLTRAQVKAVYRDIVTNSFSLDKTADIISKSLQIEGYEIYQIYDNAREMWKYKNSNTLYPPPIYQTSDYKLYNEHRLDDELGFYVHDRGYAEKYDGDKLLWQVSYSEFVMQNYAETEGGTLLWGYTPTISSKQISHAWLSFVSDEGEIKWTVELQNGFEDESIEYVIENKDGTLAVMSRGELKYFCLSQYTKDGEMLHFAKTEIGNYGIWNAAVLGNGYIVQLGSFTEDEYARIVKVDKNGTISDSFSYSAKDCVYHISDMMEFEDRIYLSGYAIPVYEDSQAPHSGGHYELQRVFDTVISKYGMGISSEDLTPLVKDNYTAVLLVCDPSNGTPGEFFSVKGALGSNLSVKDSCLVWDTQNIVNAVFSPYTSSHTIRAHCTISSYTFDLSGTLKTQTNTDETTIIYR